MDDYIAILLRPPSLLIFLPLILFSAGCLACWLFAPDSARKLSVRIGVYTGAALAAQFFVEVLCTSGPASPMVAVVCAPVLAAIVFGCKFILKRSKRFTIRHLMGLTTIVAIAVLILQRLRWDPISGIRTIFLFSLMAGPTLNLVTYVRASVEIWRGHDLRESKSQRMFFVGWIMWLIAWATSWKLSVDSMLVEYAKLPTTDPNCYVGSAAAHGHSCLVGACGSTFSGRGVANMQMRRLKFLEFAFAAAAPGTHTIVRRVYNRLGPPAARVCRQSVWFADATYLMLKPLEMLAVLICLATGIPLSRIHDIYGDRIWFLRNAAGL